MKNLYNKTSYQKGCLYEENASKYLIQKNYQIIESRYKNEYGEIDIIAKYNNIIVAIEVKFRKNMIDGLYCISNKQKTRIANSFNIFLNTNANYDLLYKRFDAIIIDKFNNINHIEGAWLYDSE